MIEYDQALETVEENCPRSLDKEMVPLHDAVGRVLAADVASDVNLPPFNRSAMDGFAVRADDIKDLPATIQVVMDVAAGAVPDGVVGSGEAACVMTGAPVPEGADTVVQVEWTSGFGGSDTVIEKGPTPGANIGPMGEIVKEGQSVLTAGQVLSVEEVALLAAVGCDPVPVHGRPTVGILSTGDELVPPGTKPGPSQIRDVNGPALAAFIKEQGLTPIMLGCISDDKESLTKAIEDGLKYDCLLLSGGVSAGAYDFVEEVLAKAGVNAHFRRVAIKPGKPTVFGTRDGHMIFGLPGNPLSAMVVSRLFVGPALRKTMGLKNHRNTLVKARLTTDLKKKPNRQWFVYGMAEAGDEITVSPIAGKGSADLLSSARGNCLIVAPREENFIAAGSLVDVVVWERTFR